MLKEINGIKYCELGDLTQLGKSESYIRNALQKFRQGKSSKYANILDPTHTGRGRKRLVQIDSLPTELKARVRELLGISSEAVKEALELTSIANPEAVAGVAVQAIEQTIELSLPYVQNQLEGLAPKAQEIGELQTRYAVDLTTAAKWALLREVIRWVQNEAERLPNTESRKTLRRLVVRCQRQSPALMDNLPKLSSKILTEKASEVTPKNVRNQNAAKGAGNEQLANWLRAHYAQGNRPKVADVYKAYCQARVALGFPECTLQSMYNWVKPFKQEAELKRKGLKGFKLDNTITVNRKYPDHFAEVISMDATAFNAWIWNEKKEKAYQSVWRCIAMDVSSAWCVAKASQSKESPTLYIETFQEFVKKTAILPKVVEIDHFAGWQRFEKFLAFFGVKLHLISTGNARAKIAEGTIGLQQSYIERYNQAFSGMNINSADGRLSDEYMKLALANRLTYSEALRDIEVYTPKVWNNRRMKQYNRKQVNQSPNELRIAKSGTRAKLKHEMYYRITGRIHEVKLTIDGLVIHRMGVEYIYFPAIDPKNTDATADFFNSYLGQKFKVYVVDYDSKALVCDLEDRIIGYWDVKPTVPYHTSLFKKGDGETFAALRAIQESQVKKAKKAASEAEQHYPDAAESYLKMHAASGDKDIQMNMENYYKLGEGEFVDTDTGEVFEAKEPKQAKAKKSGRWVEYKHPTTGVMTRYWEEG